jgi:OmpA-OmpF porin, OOP family
MKYVYIFILCFGLIITDAYSQFGLQEKLKQKVEEKVEKEAEEEIDETLDGKKKEKDNQEEQLDESKNEKAKERGIADELKAFSKFDFVPGEKVLFYDDFSTDEIGDFPANWNTNGSGEVVTLSKYPGKWFKLIPGSTYYPEIKGPLPENYTLEFDYINVFKEYLSCFTISLYQTEPDQQMDGIVPGKGGVQVWWDGNGNNAQQWKDGNWGDVSMSLSSNYFLQRNSTKIRISIAVQKQRFKLYIDENKIFDIPRLMPLGILVDRIRFTLWSCETEGYNPLISNYRIAVGKPVPTNKLITEGKLVTNGIYFDSGSDIIKPESYGTIKEIANILKENPTIKVKIVGHTDSDGNPASNLTLSQKRAESVKNFLVKEFTIDGTKLTTEGKGQTEPLSPNNSPENKANNRRVEFIKQ